SRGRFLGHSLTRTVRRWRIPAGILHGAGTAACEHGRILRPLAVTSIPLWSPPAWWAFLFALRPHSVPMPSITPLNKTLILINVVVFGLQYLLGAVIDVYFALWPPQAAQSGYPPFLVWQLL